MLRRERNAAVQNNPNTTLVTPIAPISTATHGGRAKCLQRLARLDLPVPTTVALSFDAVHKIASENLPDIEAILEQFPQDALLCVRPSSEDPDWGGPSAILNIGMSDARVDAMAQSATENETYKQRVDHQGQDQPNRPGVTRRGHSILPSSSQPMSDTAP